MWPSFKNLHVILYTTLTQNQYNILILCQSGTYYVDYHASKWIWTRHRTIFVPNYDLSIKSTIQTIGLRTYRPMKWKGFRIVWFDTNLSIAAVNLFKFALQFEILQVKKNNGHFLLWRYWSILFLCSSNIAKF